MASTTVLSGSMSDLANNSASAAAPSPMERRCENADCNVVKLVSMVPKRKTTQFVTEPNVMDKPMLINGFTTVFQVDGGSAKLSDLKNPVTGSTASAKTIFRIVPNTHAHIVNYVVVDAAGGDSLRKINESDPATMRKLLESQKVSADQMLKKLMAGHGTGMSSAGVPPTVNTVRATGVATPPLAPISKPMNMPPTYAAPASKQASNSPIQLPVRMHPNLKITAVASGETLVQSPVSTTNSSVPYITPVPLSSLQTAAAPIMHPVGLPASTAIAPVAEKVDKPVFDKMQEELSELRRTVAMLAEAQAKNQQNQQIQQSKTTPPDNFRRVGVKRPRQN